MFIFDYLENIKFKFILENNINITFKNFKKNHFVDVHF